MTTGLQDSWRCLKGATTAKDVLPMTQNCRAQADLCGNCGGLEEKHHLLETEWWSDHISILQSNHWQGDSA